MAVTFEQRDTEWVRNPVCPYCFWIHEEYDFESDGSHDCANCDKEFFAESDVVRYWTTKPLKVRDENGEWVLKYGEAV